MIIYGKQVSLYALKHHEPRIKTVYLAKKGLLPKPIFDRYKSRIKFLENRWAQAMSKGGNHQGILLEIDDSLLESALPDSYWQLLMLLGAMRMVPMKTEFVEYGIAGYFGMAVAYMQKV